MFAEKHGNHSNTMNLALLVTLYEISGGVETLIFRMANWLSNHGHNVILFTNKIVPPLDKIRGRTIILNHFESLDDIWRAKLHLRNFNNISLDVIKTFHVYDARKGAALAGIIKSPVKLICGVYTPLQFDPGVMGSDTIKSYLSVTKWNTRVVCFADSLLELEKLYYPDRKIPVQYWPLPVADQVDDIARDPKWGKIVSIGRIADMKTYNFFMVDVVNEIKDMGYNVEYHIHGDGELKDELLKYIKHRDKNKCVYYHGLCEYHNFKAVCRDAYIFVGMGTALIEAGQYGLPGLCCIPYDQKRRTYGPFSKFPFDLGMQKQLFLKDNYPYIKDEIIRILEMSKEEYAQEEHETRKNGSLWSLDARMQHFLEIVNKAPYFSKLNSALHIMRAQRCIKNNLHRLKKVFNYGGQ